MIIKKIYILLFSMEYWPLNKNNKGVCLTQVLSVTSFEWFALYSRPSLYSLLSFKNSKNFKNQPNKYNLDSFCALQQSLALPENCIKYARQALYSSSSIVTVTFTSPNSLIISTVIRNFCATSFMQPVAQSSHSVSSISREVHSTVIITLPLLTSTIRTSRTLFIYSKKGTSSSSVVGFIFCRYLKAIWFNTVWRVLSSPWRSFEDFTCRSSSNETQRIQKKIRKII